MSHAPANTPAERRFACHAKINLLLRILAREENGFHQIETIFCATTLADELLLKPGGTGIQLRVHGAELGPPESNLVFRAARAFFDATALQAGIEIVLTKRIPAGAGLGGGSADAAATLLALNEMFAEPLSADELLDIAASIGSDLPFFLCGSALALAWGRGQRLLPLPPLEPSPLLLLIPPFPINTTEAYRELALYRSSQPTIIRAAVFHSPRFTDWEQLAKVAVNDFEPPTFQRFPVLLHGRDALRQSGAHTAMLAGSGSALFGLFPSATLRNRAATILASRFPDCRVIEGQTIACPPVRPLPLQAAHNAE